MKKKILCNHSWVELNNRKPYYQTPNMDMNKAPVLVWKGEIRIICGNCEEEKKIEYL